METYSNNREKSSNYHLLRTHEEPIDLTNGNLHMINKQQSTSNYNPCTEIIESAKSLFMKRTRTLYHWMYPNIPKQQIKVAISNSWDNLAEEEKQYYISQVRFTFPQNNLMINPQLNDLKLHKLINTNNSNTIKENAIVYNSKGLSEKSKKRPGRPIGSRNKKCCTFVVRDDFKDDPELFKEFKKFTVCFDHFSS